jgi:hypothetical protein
MCLFEGISSQATGKAVVLGFNSPWAQSELLPSCPPSRGQVAHRKVKAETVTPYEESSHLGCTALQERSEQLRQLSVHVKFPAAYRHAPGQAVEDARCQLLLVQAQKG